MKATSMTQTKLAVHQSAPPTDPRMALRRMRVALAEVITKAPTPQHFWHDLTREDPRSALPFEKERSMLHAAIAQGCTTPERIIRYRLAQMHDDLAQFAETPLLEEMLYVELMNEQHEALHAQARAHAFPGDSLEMDAIRETEEANVVMRAYCWLMREGRSLLQPSLA